MAFSMSDAYPKLPPLPHMCNPTLIIELCRQKPDEV